MLRKLTHCLQVTLDPQKISLFLTTFINQLMKYYTMLIKLSFDNFGTNIVTITKLEQLAHSSNPTQVTELSSDYFGTQYCKNYLLTK